ncbi:MAG: gfo/Idh/MocA family oxidoreductase, partial [Thermoguttaceae bacterium]|nr:gfo/Idh/MocA family oxidoreductase [Thermoguttaceae bacterium]
NGGKPISDIESHIQSLHLCHLSAIAARLKRTIAWDSKNETIVGDDQAASFLSREQRAGFEIPEP